MKAKYNLQQILFILYAVVFLLPFSIIATGQSPSINVPSSQVLAGGEMTISYANFPGNNHDWIGLYSTTANDRQFVTWQYTNGKKNGTMIFKFPASGGQYEFRSFPNDSYNFLCKSSVVVVGQLPVGKATITLPSSKAFTEEVMTISYTSFPGNSHDWIGLYSTTANDKQFVSWQYTNGKKNGTMNFKFPATGGQYEFRSFPNDSYNFLCKSAVVVVEKINVVKPMITLSTSQAVTGGEMTISYSNFPGNSHDWIGLYSTTANDRQFVSWQYTNGKKNGTMVFKMPPASGQYEFRSFPNDSYTLLCKSPAFPVVK